MPQIGPYTLHRIETGRFGLDGGAMFGIIPKPLWQRQIPADDRNRIPLAMRCLLLEGDGRVVLIDTGLGHKYDAKFADIYAVDHAHASLEGSLRAAGFAPEDVTDVILTHLHFDHCGGSTYRNAEGRLALTFPKARHHLQADHWAWAQASNARERNSFLAENLEPLAASGQLNLLEGPGTLFPGMDLLTVNGHTRAQQLVKISDDTRTLLYVADLVPTAAHLPLVWVMGYDLEPLVTMDEKTRVLDQAVSEGWSLLFEHDPEVEVAEVEATERGYRPAHRRPLHEL